MEQLVARWAHNPKVVGSSPAPATKRENWITGSLFSFNSLLLKSDNIVFPAMLLTNSF